MSETVTLKIDGVAVTVPKTKTAYDPQFKKHVEVPTTLYDAAMTLAEQTGKPNPIPILCHREHVNPVAVCRLCVVQDRPGAKLTPACHRAVDNNMDVQTAETNTRVRTSIKVLLELLLADQPAEAQKKQGSNPNELFALAERYGVKTSRFPKPPISRGQDDSSLVIAVDHDACILCDRCIRGCNEIRDNQVLGRAKKGYVARIAFDLNNPMGDSSCVACGECMISCPTGALTFRTPVKATPPPQSEALNADALHNHPLFDGVALPFLRWNESSIVRRRFKAGDIICREGDFGSSAFYIENGKVDILLTSPLKHVKQKPSGGLLSLLGKFTSSLTGRAEDRRDEEGSRRYIPVDAPVTLRYDNPIAQLEQGDIFGEMTCMSSYPRSATVRAAGDVTVLEFQRNVLYILQRNKKSRAKLDESYRRKAIDNHLRGVGIFADQFKDEGEFNRFVDFLRPRVELVRLVPGEVIFRQDDPADHFYLVRVGFVKVSERRPGGDAVLTYIGPGGYFGEIGLMATLPGIQELAPAGVRVATCSALDHVDLVRINGPDFAEVLKQFPAIRERLTKLAIKNLENNEAARSRVQGERLGEFLKQGLMNAQKLLVLDLEKCTRCDECTRACADTHDGVTRLVREGLRFDHYLVASSCRSCLDPYCMVGCPVGSIRRQNSREIIIEDWCIGCGKCAENCPYGNINMHPFPTDKTAPDPATGKMKAVMQQKATTCDLCHELPDASPSCVYACPHDAAFKMSGEELINLVEGVKTEHAARVK
jgi:CRP-like cAMP-binding protein/Fe-S-cluster-containing hydrogenase component 2